MDADVLYAEQRNERKSISGASMEYERVSLSPAGGTADTPGLGPGALKKRAGASPALGTKIRGRTRSR